jgi:hypothetical protein
MTSEMKTIEERAGKKVIKVADDIKAKDFYISRITEEIGIKGLKIDDLKDVLNHRKTQFENKKG